MTDLNALVAALATGLAWPLYLWLTGRAIDWLWRNIVLDLTAPRRAQWAEDHRHGFPPAPAGEAAAHTRAPP